jgi:ArsR family metal-binding transcriptional regulator
LGRSHRRESHGENVVGRLEHDKHGRTWEAEEEVRIELTEGTPIVPSSSCPRHGTSTCIAAGVVYVSLWALLSTGPSSCKDWMAF